MQLFTAQTAKAMIPEMMLIAAMMQSTYQPIRNKLGMAPQFTQSTACRLIEFPHSWHSTNDPALRSTAETGLGSSGGTKSKVSIPHFGHAMVAPALSESNCMD